MKDKQFVSILRDSMTNFVEFKRVQGFDYNAQNVNLGYFDRFLYEQNYRKEWLDQTIVNTYIEKTAHLAPNTRISVISIVRVFSRYLHHFFPQSYVLHDISIKRPTKRRYHLLSPKEIKGLLAYAKTITMPKDSLRSFTFHLLLGLLYTTGLRINEALSLTMKDVNIQTSTIFVRKGKFSKDRYVMMHHSTCKMVKEYISKRMYSKPCDEDDPFFITSSGKPLTYKTVSYMFQCAIKKCGILVKPKLRFHDFRHNYACNCLAKWYREGKNINAMLPILATSLGHVDIRGTQIYLHTSEYIREEVAQRFHQFFKKNRKER